MAEIHPNAKRHADYVQIVPLRTEADPLEHPEAPSLKTFAEEKLRVDLSPEPDGYARISMADAEDLLIRMDEYVNSWGPLSENDRKLAAEVREILDASE